MVRFSTRSAQADFDSIFVANAAAIQEALRRVGDQGATALTLLPTPALQPLAEEARGLRYRAARPVVGEGEAAVYQDFRLTTELPPEGRLMSLANAFDRLVDTALADMRAPPLPAGFHINDYIVQHYPAGCAGMSPHRDHIRYTGLVAIVILAGAGRFLICDDRAGNNEREIPSKPGDLLLMRAPGFQGRGDRPFHAVRDITQDRYILGLRHNSRPGDAPG
jgi:hypothetical protein